jgi:hypothetical protein
MIGRPPEELIAVVGSGAGDSLAASNVIAEPYLIVR